MLTGGAVNVASGERAGRPEGNSLAISDEEAASFQLPDFITNQLPRWSATERLSHARQMIILAVCSQALFLLGMDNTIVNVGLPSIGHSLKASVSGLQWTMSAYTIMLASFMLLGGSLGDRFGRRTVFQAGLATFTLGSWLCSIAPSLAWLIAFRMIQGIGGALTIPVAGSIITVTFTDKAERARAIGIWSSINGIGMALGPIAGGLLTATVGWPGTFWINIPFGLAGVVLAAILIPESRTAQPRRLDPVGQVLVIAVLGALTYAIIEAPSAGWRSGRVDGAIALVIVALVVLLKYEARRPQPLIDTRFFLSVPFSGAIVTGIASFAALGGVLFLATLYFQDVLALSPLQAGLRMLPTALGMSVCAPVAGRIMARHGSRIPLLLGGLCITVGVAALAPFIGASQQGPLAVAFEGFGIGVGMVNPIITTLAVSGMPMSHTGIASGMSSASRQVGQALGVATAGSILAAGAHGALRMDFTRASQGAWWVFSGSGYLILILAFVTTTPWAARTAESTARTFTPLPALAPAARHRRGL